MTCEKSMTRQKKVLLLTPDGVENGFFGDLFNNNADAFYVFEPLAGIEPSSYQCLQDHDVKRGVLGNYFHCSAPKFREGHQDRSNASKIIQSLKM